MKKISNLLILALLTIGMGLTSCDEMLDNAVDPGVMPDVEVTSIALNATSQVLNVDDYFALTATVEPADADYEKIIWSSSDETIATVDETGIIHAVAEGNAIITAQAGNMKATCDILVQDVYDDKQYKEATWDATNSKVVFKKKSVESVALIDNDFSGSITSGWYSVTGDNVIINNNVTLTGDLHLILCDGAKLTINGQLDCGSSGNLYIYGQKKGDGKLNVTNSSGIAIISNSDLHIDIHGGEVTAEATGNFITGLDAGYLAVYGGKLTATSGGSHGIVFGNTIDVYGGEVVATSNATSSVVPYYGIECASASTSEILTVYGGKVKATGNGVSDTSSNYGSGFLCYVKSGTSDIKFYFSADGTTWGDGTSYDSATKVGTDDATKKRYAKAE